MSRVIAELSELYVLCRSSVDALEAALADEEVIDGRRAVADELADLLRAAGVELPPPRRDWRRAVRLFLHGHSLEALARESARSDEALLRGYERAFESGLPLQVASVLLTQHLVIERQKWRPSSDAPLPARPHYAPLLPSLREGTLSHR